MLPPAVRPDRDDARSDSVAPGRASAPPPPPPTEPPTADRGPDRLRRAVAVLGSRHLALVVVLVPMAVLIVSQIRVAGLDNPTISDYGLLELGTSAASRGEQLLGPYSRYGWNHPGPFLFYWNVPFWAATGRHFGGLALAAAVLNTVSLAGLVAVAGRIGGRLAAWCAAGGVLVLLVRYDIERMREPWNPTLTVTTTALTIALAVGVAAGRRWMLPLLAIAASAAVQIHIGTGPTVVAMVVVAVVMAVVADRRRLARWAVPALVTVATVGVMWALPIAEQLQGGASTAAESEGNLSELSTFFTDVDRSGQEGGDALQAVTKLVSAQDPDLSVYAGPAGVGFSQIPELSTGDVVGASVLVGVLLLGVGLAIGWRDRTLGAWAALPLAALVAAYISATSVDGVLYLYLIAFTTGTALMAWIAAAVVVVALVGRLRRQPRTTAAKAPTEPNPVLAGSIAVLAGLAVFAIIDPAHDTDAYAEVMRSPEAVDLLPAIEESIAEAGTDVVLVRIAGPGLWAISAPIVDALEDDGIDVRIDPEWTFMFGEHRVADGDEELVISVMTTADSDRYRGLTLLDEANGVTIALGGTYVVDNGTFVGIGSLVDDDGVSNG